MGYGEDYANFARRHLAAAQELDKAGPAGRRCVAGYLYGIAAETALKQIMRQCRFLRGAESQDYPDPYFLHFPALKTALSNHLEGRADSRLLKYANAKKLMQEWDTDMRYAPSADVLGKPIKEWAAQAKNLVEEMGEV